MNDTKLTAYPDPMLVPYSYVTTTGEARTALAEMATAELLAVDTETEALPGSDLDRDGPGPWVVLSAAARFRHDDGSTTDKVWVINMSDIDVLELQDVFSILRPYAWNATFERRVLRNAGVRCAGWLDLMLYEVVLRQGEATEKRPFYAGLALTARNLLAVELEGKGSIQLSYKRNVALTDEQKAYAAQDAVVTLWLAPLLTAAVATAGLQETAELESAALPFIQDLQINGIWMDGDGWRSFVRESEEKARRAESLLADMTNCGQGSLFDAHVKPSWSPSKPEEVKDVLNQYCEAEVRAYMIAQSGDDRLLAKSDSVDHDALTLIGGDIAKTLLEWAEHNKIVTTYGDKFLLHAHDDGRFHARYNQALVATGRLSSDKPNFQNLPGAAKAFLRPTAAPKPVTELTLEEAVELGLDDLRVFVACDLSQAELRKLAQESGDPILIEAYRAKADLHVTTASRMFKLDMQELEAKAGPEDRLRDELEAIASDLVSDEILEAADVSPEHPFADRLQKVLGAGVLPDDDQTRLHDAYDAWYAASSAAKRYADLRAKGKTLNFGVVYGLSAASLAKRLTVEGVETSIEEGRELLKLYDEAYPGIASWLQKRDAYIKDVSENLPDIDWEATWQLYRAFPKVKDTRFRLKDRLGRWPSADEVAAELVTEAMVSRELERRLGRLPDTDEVASDVTRRRNNVRWVHGFATPVVVLRDRTPFAFESRTSPVGRRRLFQVAADDWLTSMMVIAARTYKQRPGEVRDAWGREHNIALTVKDASGKVKPLPIDRLKKRFEGVQGRELKQDFVSYVLEAMPDAATRLMEMGLKDCIRAAGRQFRNQPIQGGVADAVLLAYALLDERLVEFETVKPVQSVHDSIVVECSVLDARRVLEVVRDAMEEALGSHCPDVPVVADGEITASLDAKRHLIDDATLDRLIEMAGQLAEARKVARAA